MRQARSFFMALPFLTVLAGASAEAQTASASSTGWRFEAAPYFWAAGVEATVGVRRLPTVEVEASFGDILENFDFGLLGRSNARKGRWGFGTDLMWMNLGATLTPDRPIILILEPEVDMRQLLAEGFGSYRFAENPSGSGWAEVLVGARYFGARTTLHFVGGDRPSDTFDWVDAMAGLRARAPLGSKAGLLFRGDIAGLGSDFTYNLEGQLELSVSKRWNLSAGYRYLDIDYESGSGADRLLFQAVFKGPVLQATYAW